MPAIQRLLAALLVLAASGAAVAQEDEGPQELVARAETTIATFASDPNLGWFRDHVGEARGIMIVPRLLRGGLIVGGSGGNGVLLARDPAGGAWSGPAFYGLGSVSIGLQIGAELAEVVLLIMTDAGLESFLATSVKLGADASIAAGPVGVGAKAQTADILAFSRAKGAYGGLSLEGSVVTVRTGWNEQYYGQEVRPIDILIRGSADDPAAEDLRRAVAGVAGN